MTTKDLAGGDDRHFRYQFRPGRFMSLIGLYGLQAHVYTSNARFMY
jgi:hypothetical protein